MILKANAVNISAFLHALMLGNKTVFIEETVSEQAHMRTACDMLTHALSVLFCFFGWVGSACQALNTTLTYLQQTCSNVQVTVIKK